MNKILSKFSLRKSHKIMQSVYRLYMRKKGKLSTLQKEKLEKYLKSLQEAVKNKNVNLAKKIAQDLKKVTKQIIPKTFFDHILDLFLALIFAFVVAIVVRQMWFENYTIPSGSMRPTLKERDFLIVSKTNFGINTLGKTSHLYFDPNLINRGGIVIFSGENMDIKDVDTTYFFIIPGTKQYIKRLVGKPRDILYFYGGQIFGIDANGQEIKDFRCKWFTEIEHIPFIRFEGKIETDTISPRAIYSPVFLHQMNIPIARLFFTSHTHVKGEMLIPISNYANVWGFKNFAMARILSKDQIKNFTLEPLENASLYLELTHHPTIKQLNIGYDEYGRLRPYLSYSYSYIPLKEKHIQQIFNHLYTCRFIVQDGLAYRYGQNFQKMKKSSFWPKLDIPNGCYEFQDGVAYKVFWGGIIKKLDQNHPIYNCTPSYLKLLFNLGIEFNTLCSPYKKEQFLIPSRYAYFKTNDLYLMGYPIFHKTDKTLINFIEREKTLSIQNPTYSPFEDVGPPLKKDGSLDLDFIKKYGLKVPEKMYLVLGDNHAMSADSRDFGFVPQANLRGGASFLFWPPSKRFGPLFQPRYKLFCLPKIIVWSSAVIIIFLSYFYFRRKKNRSLKF